MDVSRSVFERNREVAVIVFGTGTWATLSDVLVRNTLERECASDSCPGYGGGTGIGSYAGAHADLMRFVVSGSAMCGLQLAHGADETGATYPEGGTMDLRDGEISFNAVCGANIQTEDFDIDRIALNVWCHDNNGMNLDMTELPVPVVGTPLAE